MELLLAVGAPGLLLTLILGVPPVWIEYRRSRNHVRLISARINHQWEAVNGDINHLSLVGGELVVTNAGQHQVQDLIIQKPHELEAKNVKRLGPGERYTLQLPTELAAQLETEPIIVMQVEDANKRLWRWTPASGKLDPIPPKITLLARLVQLSSRRWPKSWHIAFQRLPEAIQRILWGYLPAG